MQGNRVWMLTEDGVALLPPPVDSPVEGGKERLDLGQIVLVLLLTPLEEGLRISGLPAPP